jgi:hypothetical protein
VIRKAARQLVKEQWISAVLAAAMSLVVWAFVREEGKGWTVATILGAIGPWVAFAGGAVANWFRIRSGQRTSQTLSTIEINVRQMLADFDVRMTDAVGHITGGESYPCLVVDPDRGLLVLVRGKYSIRDLRVDFADAAAASPALTPTETLEFRHIAAGTGKKRPIEAFDNVRHSSDEGRLYIKFSALNGIMHQFLDFRKEADGSWVFATRVMAHGDKVERIDPGFVPPPLDWDSEMQRFNITLDRLGQANLAPLP